MELDHDDEHDASQCEALETDGAAFEAPATNYNAHTLPGALQQLQDERIRELREKLEKSTNTDQKSQQTTSAADESSGGGARQMTRKQRRAASQISSQARQKLIVEQAELIRLEQLA